MSSFCQAETPCIGFSNLPEQMHRKAVKKGFDFTVMVVGRFHVPFVKYSVLAFVIDRVRLLFNWL